MDEDDILIEVKLDDREITRQMDALGRKLQKSLNVALGGNASGGGTTQATRAIKDQEAAAIKLAQAQARLATASGDLSKAQTTLNTALAGVNKQTITSINAQTQLAQVQNRMSRTLKDMADSLQNIGSRLTIGLTLPLGALAGAAIKTAVDFDSLKRGLISVSGSAEAADKQLARLKETAKLPGLSFREAIQGSINLQAAGFSAERAERSLRVFGNALATVGKGSTELSGVITALTQIESKGKVSAEEINQLAERVPQIRRAIVAAFGTADTEIIQKAKITSRQFIDAVVTELDKLPKVTGGARNTFENLKDSIEQSLLPLGNRLLETILPAIEKLTPKVLGLLDAFGKLSPEVQTVAIGFGAAAFAAGPLIGALGNILFLLTQIRNLGGVSAALGLGGAASGLGRILATPAGVAGAAGSAAALGVFLSSRELDQRIAALQHQFEIQSGNRPLLDPAARAQEEAALKGAIPITGPFTVGKGISAFDPATGRLARSALDAPQIDVNKLARDNTKRQAQKSELDKTRDNVKSMTEKVRAVTAEEGKLFEEIAKLDLLRAQFEIVRAKQKDEAFKRAKQTLGIPLAPELPGGIGLPTIPLAVTGRGPAGAPTITSQTDLDADRLSAARTRGELADQRLRIQEVQVQEQVNRGLLTEAQAQQQLNAARRASRDELIASLEAQRAAVDANSIEGLQITEQIERLRFLGVELSLSERFMRGFASATDSVGDAFDRFGQNVARAFGNVRDLFNSLKQAVLGFFNDLLGQSLQNLVRQTLGPLLGGLGGGGAAGGLGGLFRTPGTFPAQIAQAFAGAAVGGISAPPSITATQQLQQVFEEIAGPATRPRRVSDIAGVATAAGARSGFSLSGLLGGLASSAPLLGLGLGAGLGGQSTLGNVLGAIGGSAIGLGVSFGASVFSAAGGGLGALGPAALAALGPIALIGAPLLVGAIFAGKAAQRRKDEEASGQFLTQALQGIEQLAAGVASGQIDASQARSVFETQILGTFRQQISGLKTASVRESRLRNQVADLEKVYQARIPPLIVEQQRRAADAARFAAIDSRLIPQFAVGGIAPGGLALLHPNEMVLTRAHQRDIRAVAGPDIFERVGVPGVQQQPVFDRGGVMPSGSSFGRPQIVIQNLIVESDVVMSEQDARRTVRTAFSGQEGEDLLVENVQSARKRKRL